MIVKGERMPKKRSSKMALGAIVGVGIGYAAGILTAPKSGKQTRKDIQRAALKAKSDAEKKLKHSHSELNKLINQAKRQTKNLSDKTKQEVEDALTKAQSAKEKARELLSAIHEGDPQDKDLQKALNEVKQATLHLKNFLNKKNGKKTTKP